MFCKNCGQESDDTKKFCGKCGTSLSLPQNNHAATEQQSFSNTAKDSHPGKIIRIFITAGVIVVVLGIWIYNSIEDDAVRVNDQAINAYDSGDSQQAINQFQEASQTAVSSENKMNSLKNLAYAYSSEGEKEQALNSFQQALGLASEESFDYYLISGEIALLQNKPGSALQAYNKAYQISPDDFQINNALALFYLDLEDTAPRYADYKKALDYARRSAELTDLEIAKQNLGIAYFMNENADQAISTLSSISLDKDSYTAYWIGLAYIQKNDPANAKIYLRRAIASGVDMPQEIYDYINSN